MKKILSILLAACVLQSAFTAFAQEESATNEPASMTFEDAVSYAFEHSYILASAEADIVSNQYLKYVASNTYKTYSKSNYADYSATTLDTVLILNKYYVRSAEKNLEIAQRALETKKYNLKNEVLNKFYTYLNAKNKTSFAETNLKNTEEKCSFAKTRLESGIISKNDYLNFELSVFSAENSLKQAKRSEEAAMRSLKDTLNYPMNSDLMLVGSFDGTEPYYETPDNAVLLSRNQNTYISLYDSYELAKERWEYAKEFYFPSEHNYSIEKANFESAAADFNQSVRNFDSGIYDAYDSLLTIKENIEYLKKSIDLLTVNTEAAYLRYEIGTITANDYFDIEQNLFSARNQLMDLQLSYYLSIQNYRSMYTLDNSEESNK